MKKIELQVRLESIISLINEGAELTFTMRVKCQKEIISINNLLEPVNKQLEAYQKELVEKYGLEIDEKGQIKYSEDKKEGFISLVNLNNESNYMEIECDKLQKFEENDFKNSKGELLDIKTNIAPLLSDFLN